MALSKRKIIKVAFAKSLEVIVNRNLKQIMAPVFYYGRFGEIR